MVKQERKIEIKIYGRTLIRYIKTFEYDRAHFFINRGTLDEEKFVADKIDSIRMM